MTSELPLTVLDEAAVRRWAFRARSALGEYRRRLDALNVFPVPDGDTGTNLHHTLHAALESLLRDGVPGGPTGLSGGAQALARQLLLSARGNSGVILGQLVRGLAEAVGAADPDGAVDGPLLAEAFARAQERAWEGVAEPVEGTILSVARAASRAATAAARDEGTLAAVSTATYAAAREALEVTPQQLASHARAGVVDAGGAGLVVILAALHEVVTGEPVAVDLPEAPEGPSPGGEGVAAGAGEAYEVVYVVEGCSDAEAGRLRDRLALLGDSLVLAGTDELRTVHVHTEEPGAAIEAALPAGHVHGIRVSWLGARDHEEDEGPADAPRCGGGVLGLVACVEGSGLVEAFSRSGATCVVEAPGARATPARILHAARATGCPAVVVLPGDAETLAVARVAADLAREEGRQIRVVPTTSPVQSLAVCSVFDAEAATGRDVEAVVRELTGVAEQVRAGLVATADRPLLGGAAARDPEAGDVVGVVEGRVVAVGDDPAAVALRVVEDLLRPESEVVTIVAGADDAATPRDLSAALADGHPELEVAQVPGGPAGVHLLVGVE